MAAIEFRSDLHATLVGEATGEKLNGYGEVKVLTLPNSGLKMQYSTVQPPGGCARRTGSSVGSGASALIFTIIDPQSMPFRRMFP
jgi:hypothetical protein